MNHLDFFRACFLEGWWQKKKKNNKTVEVQLKAIRFALWTFGSTVIHRHICCVALISPHDRRWGGCGRRSGGSPFSLSPGPVCSDPAGLSESSSSCAPRLLLSLQPLPFPAKKNNTREESCDFSASVESGRGNEGCVAQSESNKWYRVTRNQSLYLILHFTHRI